MLDLAARGRPRIVGHRGAMGHAPENTLASFRKALELGVDAVELDVQLSRDGELVVLHDQTLDRTTDGSGLVRDFTLAELKRLDAGRHYGEAFAGERIPTLREVFDLVQERAYVHVEIKNSPWPYAGIEGRLIDLVQRRSLVDRVHVISFDHPTIRRVKERCPDLAAGLLYACRPLDAVALARAAGADSLLPHWSYVQAMDVRLAHEVGLTVHPWVTSEPDVARSLLAFRVDSIASNHPDVIAATLGRNVDRGANELSPSGQSAGNSPLTPSVPW